MTNSLELDLRWWDAANYLTVAQIYLRRQRAAARAAARRAHQAAAARALGHQPGPVRCSTSQLNRLIRRTGADCALRHRSRPRRPGAGRQRLPRGHLLRDLSRRSARTSAGLRSAGPAVLHAGRHPEPRQRADPGQHPRGRRARLRPRRTPPGAAFDHPDLLVACVVGDGEAETGPLAGSWKMPAFLNARPRRCGPADPAPERLQDRRSDGARARHRRRGRRLALRAGLGAGRRRRRRPAAVLPRPRAALGAAHEPHPPRSSRRPAPAAPTERPRWPAIVLRTPKGWTGPHDGRRRAGRGHVPGAPGAAVGGARRTRRTWRMLEAWLRSYRPGAAVRRRRPARAGARRPRARRATSGWASTPYANGGRLRRAARPARRSSDYARRRRDSPGRRRHETTRAARRAAARRLPRGPESDGGGDFRLFCPDETASNRLGAVFEVTDRCLAAPSDRPPTTTSARTAG